MAAVLACGEGALLSGRAAGHLLGLLKGPAPTPDVTAPKQRRIQGITTHRPRTAHSLDATTWHGVPTTTVPRTLTDLAATVSLDDLARACHEAGVRYQTTPAQVEKVLDRRREREAYARGDEVRRYTYGDVYEDSRLMLAELRDLIGGRRSVAAPDVPVEG